MKKKLMIILGVLLIGNLSGCSMTTANREEIKTQEEIERCNTENDINVRYKSNVIASFYKCERQPDGNFTFNKLTEQEKRELITSEYYNIHPEETAHQKEYEPKTEQTNLYASENSQAIITKNHCDYHTFKQRCKKNTLIQCMSNEVVTFDCSEELNIKGKPGICVEFIDSYSESAGCVSPSDNCSKIGKTITRELDFNTERKANYRCEKTTKGKLYYHMIDFSIRDELPENSQIDLPF